MDLIAMIKWVYKVREDIEAVLKLPDNFPLGFEYIGMRILDGDLPSEQGIYTKEVYEEFKKLWGGRYNETLPEYRENGASPYIP